MFNDKTGAVFEYSAIPLRKWYLTIYTYIRLKTNIRQLDAELAVSYNAVAVPSDLLAVIKGCQLGESAFWVKDSAQLSEPNETWAHEYVHTRQTFDPSVRTAWFVEGVADYLAARAAVERGGLSFDQFHTSSPTRQTGSNSPLTHLGTR